MVAPAGTMTLTQNPISDLMHLRWGVVHVKEAQSVMQAENIKGAGSLLKYFGVNAGQLERLGLSPVNAKAVLSAEGWRGTMGVSRQLSQSLTSSTAATSMLESVKSGWGSFEQQLPNLSKAARGAASTCKAAATGAVGRCGQALNAAKSSGFFGGITKALGGLGTSIAKMASPITGTLSKVFGPLVTAFKNSPLARLLPIVNLVFVVTDGIKAVKTLMDPTKSWGEKLAACGKAALSIGAALPIPGASLLGGARGVWAVGDAANSLMKR